MKDRFKFRAWDKKNNTYYNPLNIKVNGLTLTIKDNVGTFDMFAHDLELSSIVIEQCTGLKDKNGKLIYEGDIVRVDEYVYYSEPLTLVIAFHNGAFIAGDRYIDNNSVHMKIIGNIHENPELLEK